MDRWPYLHLLPGAHLSNSGFSPQSKESCRSLTRLAWPGIRKRPSSVSPRSRMKSTHCSTSSGARRGPDFRSWWTVSSRRCPKTPGHREELVTPSASWLSSGGDAGDSRGSECCQGPGWHPRPRPEQAHQKLGGQAPGGWDRAEGHIRPQLRLACGACPSLRTLWALGKHALHTLFMYWFIYAILTLKWQWLAFKNLTPQAPKDALRNVLSGAPCNLSE